MYLQEGSPLLDRFDQIILRVVSAGLVDFWWGDIVHVDRLAAVENVTTVVGEYSVMVLTHFQSAFTMLILGYVCSVLLFVCEISCNTAVFLNFRRG
jgi:hypothetical protein